MRTGWSENTLSLVQIIIIIIIVLCKIYSKTSVISTPLRLLLAVLFMEVSLFRWFYVYTCQCEGYNIGQSNGVLLEEVAAFQRCPFITEVHCKQ